MVLGYRCASISLVGNKSQYIMWKEDKMPWVGYDSSSITARDDGKGKTVGTVCFCLSILLYMH
jgi:hypothetical protein